MLLLPDICHRFFINWSYADSESFQLFIFKLQPPLLPGSSVHIFHDNWSSNSEVLHPLPPVYFPLGYLVPFLSLFLLPSMNPVIDHLNFKNISTLNFLKILTFCQTNPASPSKINQYTTLLACLCIAKEKPHHSGDSNKTNSCSPTLKHQLFSSHSPNTLRELTHF